MNQKLIADNSQICA